MAANKPGKAEILAAFFDDGTYSPLFTDGAVSAAYGCANGQNTYVVFEDGSPVGVQDIEKNIRVLEMAAETGAPVVTFYDSTGAKLEGGLDLLNANARLTAEIARVSGVVPQVAVVTGTCAGTNAINAAAADVCVMAEDAELFLNAPFNAEDKVANAGSAAFAAKAGVAAVTAADAVAAAKQAASIVALLPANNLAGPALFDFAAPSKALDLVKYSAADVIAALADEGSTVELYAGYGKNIVTALATINGSAVGILATEKAALCHKCTAKAARFVRLCDAYSIPVVTVVNTEGFGKSEGDDQAGGAELVPVVAVLARHLEGQPGAGRLAADRRAHLGAAARGAPGQLYDAVARLEAVALGEAAGVELGDAHALALVFEGHAEARRLARRRRLVRQGECRRQIGRAHV